jgi:hypothetical protein
MGFGCEPGNLADAIQGTSFSTTGRGENVKILNLILTTILLSAAAFAQSGATLSGSVVSSEDKAVTGSQVTLTQKSNASVTFTATSNSEGKYRFENVPAGEYIVTATDGTSSGAARANETIKVVAGQNVTQDLTVLPVVTAQVTIASGTAQSGFQIGFSDRFAGDRKPQRANDRRCAANGARLSRSAIRRIRTADDDQNARAPQSGHGNFDRRPAFS